MGVPKFFRYISERYPLINTPLPANPPQVDNLYLDMNGIIHNCVRSSPGSPAVDTKRYTSLPPDRTPHDIYLDVFKYIDNLVARLPPRRLLYMAIDGVAPRAKMNQQRSRRFRSAKERVDEHARRTRDDPLYAAAALDPFDSNCITPGTAFMAGLTVALRYFVARKLSDDPTWAALRVVLSGAEAPGEGEHKIMSFIRAQRETGHLPANTRHAVYGLDADLIMLGLITHEPHFFLLREKIDFNAWRRAKGPGAGPRVATPLDMTRFGEFELLSIGVLREYIALELGADGNDRLPYFDPHRITDDFVFFLMLIGNDFLPHLPTLDIADGTLSVMLHLYRRILPLLGGYLTHAGTIHPRRFEFLLAKLALLEEHVLRHRREESPSGRGGGGRRRGRARSSLPSDLDGLLEVASPDPQKLPAALSDADMARAIADIRARLAQSNLQALKEQYYADKFGRDFLQDPRALRDLVANYVTGVSWTLKYYTEGCRQWRWFYPFHYAPLASDIVDIGPVLKHYEDNQEDHTPFLPFEQLMSVLPPASAWCLPRPFRALMTSPGSPLAGQYPTDFAIDMNGKRNDWEAVVLLPFVDEAALMNAIKSIPVSELAREELERNQLGASTVYAYSSSYAEHVDSPFGTRLPSFVSHAKPEDLCLPSIPPGQAFTPRPLPGSKPAGSSKDLADLPTLRHFTFSAQLQSVGVNVFGMPSRSESLVLTMDGANATPAQDGSKLPNGAGPPEGQASPLDQNGVTVGSPIWYGFPWRKAGMVESIANKMVTKRLVHVASDNPSQPLTPRVTVSSTSASDFEQDASAVIALLMQKNAVAVRKPSHVVVIRTEEGASNSDKENDDPTERLHERLIKRRDPPAPGESTRPLKPGQTAMYVGHGAFFGHKCTVVASPGYDVIQVKFDIPISAAREPPFGYRVVSLSQTQRWLPLSRLASELSMSVPVVDTFLGSVRVRLSSEKEEIDLGLGVKYIGRGLLVPGYARRDERSYYSFSEKTLEVLRKYHAAFPGLFDAVGKMRKDELKAGSSGGRSKGVFTASDIFGVKHPDEAVKAAAAWLSVQDVAAQPLVSVNSDVLTPDKVTELERHCHIIQALQADYAEHLRGADTVREVTRGSLITGHEGLEWGSAPMTENGVLQHFVPVPIDGSGLRLGDRVANRLATGGVPFAMRGTVIGIHPGDLNASDISAATAKIEVVFDKSFISGGSLSGKCSDGRGKAVAANSLFIVRPERENAYYTNHYARVAARVGQHLKNADQKTNKSNKRTSAIATAAVASYAEVLKGGGGRKKEPPKPAFAPPVTSPAELYAHAQATMQAAAAKPPASSPPSSGEWREVKVTPARDNTQRGDRPHVVANASPAQKQDEAGRPVGGGVDAHVAAMPPPSWVNAGPRTGKVPPTKPSHAASKDRAVAQNKASALGSNSQQAATVAQSTTAATVAPQQGRGTKKASTRNRDDEIEQLSEEFCRAIGISKSGGGGFALGSTSGGGSVGSGGGGGPGGGSKRRGRRGGRGRNRAQVTSDGGPGTSGSVGGQSEEGGSGSGGGGASGAGSGIVSGSTRAAAAATPAVRETGDEFELSAKWEQLQQQARASRKK